MGNLGIQLGVDARQVQAAKKSVSDLATTLHELNKNNIELGGEGLARDAEMLRSVAMDITRLGNLSRIGESRGGLLNLQQWKDAATLSSRVSNNLGEWIKQSQKLKEELRQINQDLAGLQHASMGSDITAHQRDLMLTEMSSLRARRDELQKELGSRSRGDARAEHLAGRAGEYSGNIQGYGVKRDDMERAQRGFLDRISRVVTTGLAFAGGLSIGALVHKSIETYKQRETTGADMGAIGLHAVGSASDFLYSERTSAQIALARRTGYDGLTGTAAMLARGRFLSLDQTSGFMGSMYGATGMGADGIKGLTAGIFATTHNTKRQVDVLEGIEKLLMEQRNQQGGPVSPQQAAFLAGMFNSGFDKNVMLQGTESYSKLNSWISGGGKNPGEALLLWKMAGGDNFDGSMASYESILAAQQEGIANPTVFANLKKYLGGLGSDADRRMTLRSVAGLAPGQGKEADLLYQHLFNSGLDIQNDRDAIIANFESAGMSEATIRSIYGNYRGSKTRGLALQGEGNLAKGGEALGDKVQKLQEGLLDIGGKFLDGISKIHSVGDAVRESGKFLKDAADKLWNESGPFGKMLAILGGIYIGIRALSAGKAVTDIAGKIFTAGAGAGGAGAAARAGLLVNPVTAGAVAAGYVMRPGELNAVDEVAKIREFNAGGEEAAKQQAITNTILADILNLFLTAGPAPGKVAPAPALGSTQ